MNAATLDKIRKAALWTSVFTLLGLVILGVLEVWSPDLFTSEGSADDWGYSSSEPNALGKVNSTLGVAFAVSFGVLLSLLIASRVKKADD